MATEPESGNEHEQGDGESKSDGGKVKAEESAPATGDPTTATSGKGKIGTGEVKKAGGPLDFDDLPEPDYEGLYPVDDLHVDGDNPNEMSDEMFSLLVSRMRKNGWLGGAIITDKGGLIADGEHRWKAAKEIGLTEVPVRMYDVDDATRRLWRQELNKIHGEHDQERDALEYDFLMDKGRTDEVLELTKARGEDLDELLDMIRTRSQRSVAYDYPPVPDIYYEDCVTGMAERLDDNSVDVIVTDPPYGIEYDAGMHKGVVPGKHYNPQLDSDDLDSATQLWRDFLAESLRVLKPGGHIYCFSSMKHVPVFQPILADVYNFKNRLVWVKNKSTVSPQGEANYMYKYEDILFAVHPEGEARPLDQYEANALRYDTPLSGEYEHPTQKPVNLLAFLIEQSSDEAGVVFDPFMGSGSTAVAAIETKREFVGFELNEEDYREVIERRVKDARRRVSSPANTIPNASTPEDDGNEADSSASEQDPPDPTLESNGIPDEEIPPETAAAITTELQDGEGDD